MAMIRVFRHQIGIERWCRLSDFRNWQLHAERWGGTFNTLALWAGPLHVVIETRHPAAA